MHTDPMTVPVTLYLLLRPHDGAPHAMPGKQQGNDLLEIYIHLILVFRFSLHNITHVPASVQEAGLGIGPERCR